MFGASRSSKKLIAVADIGTGSAGVALVLIQKGEPARIIAREEVVLPFEKRTQDATAKGVLAGIEQAAERVRTAHAAGEYKKSRLSSLYAIIGAPWTVSRTLRAVSRFDHETKIGDFILRETAQQGLAADTTLDRSALVESSIIRVELNGYPTATPVGKSAHELSLAILVSECDTSFKSGLDDALGRAFPGLRPIIRSGTRTLLSVAHALPKSVDDYVLLDMQDEASVIIAVRNGLACEQALVAEGTRSILRRISEKGLPEETLSLIRMLERDECSAESCEAISTAMAKAEVELSKLFGDSLTAIALSQRLPEDLILVAHPDLSPWLSRFFARIDFTQCTITAQPFSVHPLMPNHLATLAVQEVPDTPDLELLISGALVNIEENA